MPVFQMKRPPGAWLEDSKMRAAGTLYGAFDTEAESA